LEAILTRLESEPDVRLDLDHLQRFHEVYERTAAALARLTTFSSEPETLRYLESLVARAYGEIHETRRRGSAIHPLTWVFKTFPQTFRRHIAAFYLSLVITLVGSAFGGFATVFDPDSRQVTMPFGHDRMTPSERVRSEEHPVEDRLSGRKSSFSAYLMTHNIQVSLLTLALGMTWGIGTSLMLFYNGVALGAIGVDYVMDGQARFLMGWLLPHGAIEIPAILIAGQAGLILAGALIGWGNRTPIRDRLRQVSPAVMTLAFGFALLLVWAGFVEAFLSQYHEPVMPYEAKIAFGTVELVLLTLFLGKSGR
jgi:uncharacterized membrane protein SpoIIM required for sporulation